MKSQLDPRFLEAYRHLPEEIRERARGAYRLWKIDPQHRSLQFKRVQRSEIVHSVRVTRSYRTLCEVREGVAVWFWIGTHAEYEEELRRL